MYANPHSSVREEFKALRCRFECYFFVLNGIVRRVGCARVDLNERYVRFEPRFCLDTCTLLWLALRCLG